MDIIEYLKENQKVIFNKTYMYSDEKGLYTSCCCKSVMMFNKNKILACSSCGRIGVFKSNNGD